MTPGPIDEAADKAKLEELKAVNAPVVVLMENP